MKKMTHFYISKLFKDESLSLDMQEKWRQNVS
jgi:hypothetical protein